MFHTSAKFSIKVTLADEAAALLGYKEHVHPGITKDEINQMMLEMKASPVIAMPGSAEKTFAFVPWSGVIAVEVIPDEGS